MPRRAKHGGHRQGTPGVAYGNRTDLNGGKIMEFVGQQYGQQARQVASQQAVPASAPPPPATGPDAASGPSAAASSPAPPLGPDPGQFGDLFGPSMRPDEPLTAGMPFGAGPGPRQAVPYDPDMDQLRKIAAATQSPALLRMVSEMGDGP